jgi:hypothetical protein
MFNSKHTGGRHRLPEVPWRPRKVQRLASLALLGAIGAAASVIITAPHAESSPGQCIRAGGWGGFCDSLPLTADGVFQHCEGALGFENCYLVRPVPTTVDLPRHDRPLHEADSPEVR